jgi:ribonuclease R
MLIEEFMLLANKIVATYFKELNLKEHFIYRVHDLPDREKLFEFAKFVKSLGFSFDPNSSNKPKQFQQLLEQASGTTEEILINDVAIRSMAKAEYSVKNIGHYGLAFKNYAHFTSPIRRFPDLVVHQILFDKLNNRKPLFSNKEIEEIAEHSSKQERNAVNAERTSVKIKQTEFMKQHIGEVFVGIISGITSWGMFIELTETLTEGLIRLRDIDGDYFVYDESKFSLVGTRTGKKYRLGDKVKVKVNRVDEKRREIDFLLSDE